MPTRDQIIAMVADAAGVDVSAINGQSELWRDLHIGGDDMLELFLTLQEQFGVNLDGLDLKNICPNEDDVLLAQITEWVRKKVGLSPEMRYTSMKVGDLIAAVESKSWSDRHN